MLLNVLKEVENLGFKVLAIVSDNNSVNRRAFELFTPNKLLKPHVQHPFDIARQLCFIFDTVHIFKCIRNNWQSKKDCDGTISFPDMENDHIVYKAKYKGHFQKICQNSISKFSKLKIINCLIYFWIHAWKYLIFKDTMIFELNFSYNQIYLTLKVNL